MSRNTLKRTVVSDPSLSLAKVKGHLRVLHDDDDGHILNLIATGFDHVERITGRAFRRSTYVYTVRDEVSRIVLPRPPFVSLTSCTGIDELPTFIDSVPAMSSTIVWPSTDEPEIVVTYEAGETTLPPVVERAILIFCDLEYHEHNPASANRMERRIHDMVKSYRVRNRDLQGVGD